MNILLIALVLSGGASAAETVQLAGSTPLASDSMAAFLGAGFAGGALCGAAMAGTAIGVMTVVGILGAGATLPLGAAFAISSAAHVAVLCTLV